MSEIRTLLAMLLLCGFVHVAILATALANNDCPDPQTNALPWLLMLGFPKDAGDKVQQRAKAEACGLGFEYDLYIDPDSAKFDTKVQKIADLNGFWINRDWREQSAGRTLAVIEFFILKDGGFAQGVIRWLANETHPVFRQNGKPTLVLAKGKFQPNHDGNLQFDVERLHGPLSGHPNEASNELLVGLHRVISDVSKIRSIKFSAAGMMFVTSDNVVKVYRRVHFLTLMKPYSVIDALNLNPRRYWPCLSAAFLSPEIPDQQRQYFDDLFRQAMAYKTAKQSRLMNLDMLKQPNLSADTYKLFSKGMMDEFDLKERLRRSVMLQEFLRRSEHASKNGNDICF